MTPPTPSSGDFVWIAKRIVVISNLNKSKELPVSLIDVVLRAQVWRSPGRVRQEVRIWTQFTSCVTTGKTLVFSGLLPETETHPFPGSPLHLPCWMRISSYFYQHKPANPQSRSCRFVTLSSFPAFHIPGKLPRICTFTIDCTALWQRTSWQLCPAFSSVSRP